MDENDLWMLMGYAASQAENKRLKGYFVCSPMQPSSRGGYGCGNDFIKDRATTYTTCPFCGNNKAIRASVMNDTDVRIQHGIWASLGVLSSTRTGQKGKA